MTWMLANAEETVNYQGNKARITVGKIKSKAAECSTAMADGVGEMLSTALTNSDNFIVLANKEEVDELIDEIDLGESGYVEEGRGPDKGLMEGADILITGAITTFEPNAGGGGGLLGAAKKKAIGAIGATSKTAKMAMEIKLIDIRTRRIIKARTVKAETKHWKAGILGGTMVQDVPLVGGMGVYSNEPMEDAARAALAEAIDVISKEIPKEYYRYQGSGQYTPEYGAQTPPAGSAASGAAADAAATTGGGQAAATVATAAPAAEDMALYTKYDFVPGNKVIFYDDLTNEEEGEFPYRWNLESGVFEIARMGGEYWILCTDDGYIIPKTPTGPLPEMYTVEMEFYSAGPQSSGSYYYIHWLDALGDRIGEFEFHAGSATNLQIQDKNLASKTLTEDLPKGTHTMRIMATKRSIKCYLDEVRVANVPTVEGFNPVGFKVRMYPYKTEGDYCMIKSFRYAEGGKSMRDQLAETGKIVTHGILFDSDSHKIKGLSYKTLTEIGELLQEDAGLRLSIEGHTDSDGGDDYNMSLSQKRSESVRNYLITTFSIAADRLEAKGWGESKPLDTNNSSEGKANNRRVELVKI
jgi:outer membrane protein OmpA-like peptidoglycan-associated protein/curli biogenesis system outer membrane secretion channel CsgG